MKTCELDYLPTYILNDNIDTFIPVLTKIVNFSQKMVCFGRMEDTNFVATAEKCGLELIESNYRLVSNLSFISKLLEQAVMNQFNTHCDLNGTTPIHQSAYKQFHSCSE